MKKDIFEIYSRELGLMKIKSVKVLTESKLLNMKFHESEYSQRAVAIAENIINANSNKFSDYDGDTVVSRLLLGDKGDGKGDKSLPPLKMSLQGLIKACYELADASFELEGSI